MEYMLVALAVSVVLLLPITALNFARTFYCYMFLFIPLYNVFLDIYVFVSGVGAIPEWLSLLKDLVWLWVLLAFLLYATVRGVTIRVPLTIVVGFYCFLAYASVQVVRSYGELGAYGSALAIRNTLGYLPSVLVPLVLIKNWRDLARIVAHFGWVMYGASAYALAQLAGFVPSRYFMMTQRPELLQSVPSFFSDYNIFAYFGGMAFALLVGSYNAGSRKGPIWLMLLATVWSIVVSQSRGGLIALIVGLSLFGLFGKMKNGVITVALIAASLVLVIAPEFLTCHRIISLRDEGLLRDVRFVAHWPLLFETFWEAPLLGHGFGLFGFARLRLVGEDGFEGIPVGVDNFYLTLALNGGLVGLILFLVLVISVWRASYQIIQIRAPLQASDFVIGVNVAIAVLLISGLTSNLLESFPLSVYFWFLIGCLLAIRRLNGDSKHDGSEERKAPPRFRASRKPGQLLVKWRRLPA